MNVTKDTLAPLLSLTNPNQNPINLIYNDTVTPVYSQSYIEYGATSDGGEYQFRDLLTDKPYFYIIDFAYTSENILLRRIKEEDV